MLARTLGRTLDELGHTISASEFEDHWQDYRRNPWGSQRDAMHAAAVVQAIGNYAGKIRKDPLEFKDTALLLNFEIDRLLNPELYVEPEPDPATFFAQFKK